jgi:hypothetical protein
MNSKKEKKEEFRISGSNFFKADNTEEESAIYLVVEYTGENKNLCIIIKEEMFDLGLANSHRHSPHSHHQTSHRHHHNHFF